MSGFGDIKHGALHKQLGYPQSKPLPRGLVTGIYNTKIGNKFRGYTVTPKMKQRAGFLVNIAYRKLR